MEKKSRNQRRKERILKEVSLAELLEEYGYGVHGQMKDREQQFACDLHGDGQDSKPSARLYVDNRFYCFACMKQRDSIAFIVEKEGLSYYKALNFLEKKYDLPPMSWEDWDEKPDKIKVPDFKKKVPQKTFEEVQKQTRTYLQRLTNQRALSFEDLERHWQSFDKVSYTVWKEPKKKKVAMMALLKLQSRIQKEFEDEEEASRDENSAMSYFSAGF